MKHEAETKNPEKGRGFFTSRHTTVPWESPCVGMPADVPLCIHFINLCSLGSCVSISIPLCWNTSSPKLPVCPHINVNIALCAVLSHSVMFDSAVPWTLACQAPLSVGILQAGRLEWVAVPSSGGFFPNPGIETRSPVLQVDSLPIWATREAQHSSTVSLYNKLFPHSVSWVGGGQGLGLFPTISIRQ